MPMFKCLMVAAAAGATGLAATANAHPGPANHQHIMERPIADRYDNYWYDYLDDVREAESEWRKDIRRAKTAQDRKEAEAEYAQEVADARKDYRREMAERGFIRRGEVYLGSR